MLFFVYSSILASFPAFARLLFGSVSVAVVLLFAFPAFGKTVVITGGNSGIGYALVNKFLDEGYDVIATYRSARNSSDLLGLAVKNSHLLALKVDLLNKNASGLIKKAIGDKPVDALINNACFYPHGSANTDSGMDVNEWLDAFLVCSIQPIKISVALLPNIRSGSERKIIMIGSRISSTTLNTQEALLNDLNGYGYKSAKSALHSSSVTLAKNLGKQGITVVIIHPGRVKTNIIRKGGSGMDPKDSADKIFSIISAADPSYNMKFLDENGGVLPF